jgi:hypothetical protein
MIECMRNGVGVEAETQTIRCERCCDELIFSIGADRQLLVATKSASEPMPAQACMPTPPRWTQRRRCVRAQGARIAISRAGA